ncbi:PqiB family protein [Azomonas macrocytogenes]|uniref:Paraquat-inducible protein B n=1 Tax=Azomonas macrocytogenes TaxID=69962 RepID=A0A839T551_AZOMA|nr:MlaD family protein [Azomonas macrocytogenes]MBB3104149.1 paraquat-inducible protein B [Azomonas macrocytogenes]
MSDLPKASVRPVSNLSVIWILPFLALAIGAWLAWQAYNQRGIEVDVVFESGEGIEVGKTAVVYKGMSVGTVQNLRLTEDGSRQVVVVTLEMKKEFQDHLRERTRFWLVRPSITLAGISGLETLVSGNYIGVSIGEGEKARRFYALAEEPPMPDSRFGLHLTLEADTLGSISRGSPVFYRQIEVGQVKNYQLAADQSTVEIKVFIKPEYTSLVRKNTRFWNASGVNVEANLTGVKLHTESLASIVAGGIAFSSPSNTTGNEEAVDPLQPFRLYENFEAAQIGIRAQVTFEDYEGLEAEHTPVMYKGMRVGVLKHLSVESGFASAEAELSLDPLIEPYLVEGTEFWLVKPSISLAGITGLEALVKGNYISIRPGEKDAAPKRSFQARAKAPPLDISSPGLHLVLFADTLGSVDIGSPILYKQVKVGSVQSYQFSRDQKSVIIGVHIEPSYVGLVNSSSRFWNTSGIALNASIAGIQMRSESLQSILLGGISFETPDRNAAVTGKIQRFQLYKDRDGALKQGVPIEISLQRADGLHPGVPIRYRGLEVGRIDSVDLSEDLQSVRLKALITEAQEQIVRAGSIFRVIRPELGLLKTANLDTLVFGPYIEVQPAKGSAAKQTRFVGLEGPQAPLADEGLSLVLSAPRLGSIKPGNPVTYREIVVGRVVDYELGPNADRVLIKVRIEPRFSPLVHTGSRFWESSGLDMDFDLLKGARIRSESLETLLQGGIAFATPAGEKMGRSALPGQTFVLFKSPQDEWLEWAPKIALDKKK